MRIRYAHSQGGEKHCKQNRIRGKWHAMGMTPEQNPEPPPSLARVKPTCRYDNHGPLSPLKDVYGIAFRPPYAVQPAAGGLLAPPIMYGESPAPNPILGVVFPPYLPVTLWFCPQCSYLELHSTNG